MAFRRKSPALSVIALITSTSTLLIPTHIDALSMTSPSSVVTATKTPSSHHSDAYTLGGDVMRDLVREAARSDARERDGDVRGILWAEHLNLVVGSKEQAAYFYQDFLGLTRDTGRSFHVNLGQQQFHLAENGEPAQTVCGSVGLVVPDLDSVRSRVAEAANVLVGTDFAVLNDDAERRVLTILCPWGNRYHLYGTDNDDDVVVDATPASSKKMVNLHADGGAYGAHRMSVRGGPGIRYVELACPPGRSAAVGRFYEKMLGCDVATLSGGGAAPAVSVCVGPGVHLVYAEREGVDDGARARMEGVHLCVYANDFKGIYDRLTERGLVWTNPRFVHLDTCDTWEEALDSRTLRFKDVIDLETGEKILELEHETRPLRHGQYLKVPYYVPR